MPDKITATTTDLGFAAALVSLGHEMSPMLKLKGSQAMFVFHMTKDSLSSLYTAYHKIGLQVDAYKIAQALKNLKRLLREQTPALE